MLQDIFEKQTRSVFESLDKTIFENFYMAGGTALALQFGHRKSIDLDFFSDQKFDTNKILEKLQKQGKVKIVLQEEKTLHIIFSNRGIR
jgi:hypothetical protein